MKNFKEFIDNNESLYYIGNLVKNYINIRKWFGKGNADTRKSMLKEEVES